MPNEQAQTTQLFYVRADDDDGNNQDLLVVAARQADVFGFWRQYWARDEQDLPEWARPVPGVTPVREPGPIDWDEITPD